MRCISAIRSGVVKISKVPCGRAKQSPSGCATIRLKKTPRQVSWQLANQITISKQRQSRRPTEVRQTNDDYYKMAMNQTYEGHYLEAQLKEAHQRAKEKESGLAASRTQVFQKLHVRTCPQQHTMVCKCIQWYAYLMQWHLR